MASAQKHPSGMFTLSIVALLHNFSFWGVVSFLPLYLTSEYQYNEASANVAYGIFLGISTMLPLLAGFASSYIKYSKLILVALLFLVVGGVLLSLNSSSLRSLSLAFVALSYGLFWPAIFSHLGRLYDSNDSLRDGGFSIFYAISSIGILLIQILGNLILQNFDWMLLYLSLAAAGILGAISFTLSSQYYKSGDSSNLKLKPNSSKLASSPLTGIEKKRIRAILILALFTIVFWMGCSQMGSSVLFFSKNFVHREIFGFDVPPTVFLSFFALTVVLMGPTIAIFWRYLSQSNIQLSAPKKMGISLMLLALSFVILSVGAMNIVEDETKGVVSAAYLFAFYFLQACSVIIMAPVGFSFVTKWAPKGWTGRLTGVWFSITGLGIFLGGYAMNIITNYFGASYLHLYQVFYITIFCAGIGLLMTSRYIMKMIEP